MSDSDFRQRRPIVCECGDHAFVAVTRGYTTMVSPEDAPLLADRKWHATPRHGRFAVRGGDPRLGGRQGNLAAAILQTYGTGLFPDHKNRDPLDNRRENLRLATASQNACNRHRTSHSAYPRGTARKPSGRFMAKLRVKNKDIYLGTFDTAEAAHKVYLESLPLYHGEFARIE